MYVLPPIHDIGKLLKVDRVTYINIQIHITLNLPNSNTKRKKIVKPKKFENQFKIHSNQSNPLRRKKEIPHIYIRKTLQGIFCLQSSVNSDSWLKERKRYLTGSFLFLSINLFPFGIVFALLVHLRRRAAPHRAKAVASVVLFCFSVIFYCIKFLTYSPSIRVCQLVQLSRNHSTKLI